MLFYESNTKGYAFPFPHSQSADVLEVRTVDQSGPNFYFITVFHSLAVFRGPSAQQWNMSIKVYEKYSHGSTKLEANTASWPFIVLLLRGGSDYWVE